MSPESATAMRAAPAEVAEPKVKVLLVDDHPDSVRSMAASLEALGEEILTATSADAALAHLLKHDVAVIVLDVMMPDMDGFQLASLIRERERFRHTPIIFLTGLRTEQGQMLAGYRSGAVDYLLKPCDPEVLRYKVKVFVDLAKKSEMVRRYARLVERKNVELENNGRKLEEALNRALSAYAELEREVAERKRVEALRDRLAGQLGATPDFIEAMAEGAVTLGLDQNIIYCNTRFAALLGRSPVEVIGEFVDTFVHPQSADVFSALFDEAMVASVKAELNLVSRDGDPVPVQVALNAFRGVDLEAVAMVVTDLRSHKRNEEMLAQGRLARQILENALSGIAVCDSAGKIILASSALGEICGCNPLFKSFDEMLRLQFPDGNLFSVADVLAGIPYRSTEVVFERADRRVFALLLSAGPLSTGGDRHGESLGCVVTVMDISELKQVEEALRRSEKLAAAGRIAGALAHEVNNPLGAITNLLYLLQHSPSLDDTARRYLELASAETERVSQIVRKTLAFYRDSNKPVPVKLSEILDNVLEVFSSAISSKKLVVNKRYKHSEVILGYPGEIRQVVTNLIANAIDALPHEGHLYVRLSHSRVWANGGRRGVRIVVADRGPGIARDHYDHLFEPFFTTKGEKGTGLGLWVTQGIVHKHGGFIRVRSSQQERRSGTVFSVFIPIFEEARSSAAQLTAASTEAIAADRERAA